MKNVKMVYSDSLCKMVVAGFTRQRIYFGNDGITKCKPIHYTWDDSDCVYYNDDTDNDFYMEVPKNGAKAYSLKLRHTSRILIRLDN